MLYSAHKGYEYQDLLSAYFVAQYIASNKLDVEFLFDSKDFDGDKFDDLKIYDGDKVLYRQIKHSENHSIEKSDFSAPGAHDLYLKDLFDSWLKQKESATEFRLCLAWNEPQVSDELKQILLPLKSAQGSFPGSLCYKIECDYLWPIDKDVTGSWKKLKEDSKSIDRNQFKSFLDSLTVEIKCPSMNDLNTLLIGQVKKIGVGTYPNDHIQINDVCTKLQSIVQKLRADEKSERVSVKKIAEECRIVLNCGGIEESFPIDKDLFVDVSDRLQTIIDSLKQNDKVIATAAPGAGKSWLISSLEDNLKENGLKVIKHFCYVSLQDSLFKERVKTDSLYGSLKTQILDLFPGLKLGKTYAADAEEVISLLNQIPSKTLLIIDGVDHVKRVYARDSYEVNQKSVDMVSAIKQLNFTNPKVRLLVVSQPLDEFRSLENFYKIDIPQISKNFVKAYLAKAQIEDKELDGLSLSNQIHEKSQGNALYCKYLVEYAKEYTTSQNFSWLDTLPPYDNNLQSYYKYIYERLDRNIDVPAALCGVDFSLNKEELKKITCIGKCVDEGLEILRPILKYNPVYGYSICHESFKRYLFQLLTENEVDIKSKVYKPLINWLEGENFYKNQKAYACLLKLYYEYEDYEKILKTVSKSFLEEGMLNACPFEDLKRNHAFQKKALIYAEDLKLHIILAEQAKMIQQIDYMGVSDFEDYLEAIKYNISNERAYEFIQREGSSRFDFDSLSHYLAKQSFKPNEDVHWDLCNFGESFELKYTGRYAVMLLKMEAYQELDDFVLETYEKYSDYLESILIPIEKWNVLYGTEWMEEIPKTKRLLREIQPKNLLLKETVDCLIKDCRTNNEKDLYNLVKNVEYAAQDASEDAVRLEIERLKDHFWFYNWIIFIIQTSRLEKNSFDAKELLEAFKYLSRDVDPFKGKPRACDLYYLYSYFDLSYRRALSLCRENSEVLSKCLSLLEKVCDLTTSLRESANGPLTRDRYLEILFDYAPEQYPISEQESVVNNSKIHGYYHDLANLYFKYSVLLAKIGKKTKAKEYFEKGVESFWGYGDRKDASLYEVLDCLTAYAHYTGKIDHKILIELFEMSMAIVHHTDGSGTNKFPIYVFERMLEISPVFAVEFLMKMGLSNDGPWGYLEEMTSVFLRKSMTKYSLEEWFLVCQTQPLLNSDSVLSYGLKNLQNITSELKEPFRNWVEHIPFVSSKIDNEYSEWYTPKTCSLYKEIFDVDISKKNEKNKTYEKEYFSLKDEHPSFEANDTEESEKYFVRYSLRMSDLNQFFKLFNSLNQKDKFKIISQYIKCYETYSHPVVDLLLANIHDDKTLIYLCVGYFIYSLKVWSKIEENIKYFNKAYSIDSEQTIKYLKQFIGMYVAENDWPYDISSTIIRILIEIKADTKYVQEAFELLYEITERKLPLDTQIHFASEVMQKTNLDKYSIQEKIVLLLISRLNRLGIEKSQHAIYALTYIAKTNPQNYIKALTYLYSEETELLPICRAALLQIVSDYIPEEYVSEDFKKAVKKKYPTGYYYEDWLMSIWVDIGFDVVHQNRSITYLKSPDDYKFIPYINPKYQNLLGTGFCLDGSHNAFKQKKQVLNKKYGEDFTLSAEQIAASHTGLSNAIYEIINEDHYNDFSLYQNSDGTELVSPFLLENIIRYVGSKVKMPSFAPANDSFRISVEDWRYGRGDKTWVTLVYNEETYRSVGMGLMSNPTTDVKSAELGNKCSENVFRLEQYFNNKDYRNDTSIIAKLSVLDSFEKHVIWFLTPGAMQKMNLHINPNMFDGLQALDENGTIVAKMIVWEADIHGSIWQGVEMPCQKGTALLFRRDCLKLLEPLIS